MLGEAEAALGHGRGLSPLSLFEEQGKRRGQGMYMCVGAGVGGGLLSSSVLALVVLPLGSGRPDSPGARALIISSLSLAFSLVEP